GGSAAGCLVWRLRTPPREGAQGTQLLRPYAAIRRALSGLASVRLFGRLGRDDRRSFNANRPYAAPAAISTGMMTASHAMRSTEADHLSLYPIRCARLTSSGWSISGATRSMK